MALYGHSQAWVVWATVSYMPCFAGPPVRAVRAVAALAVLVGVFVTGAATQPAAASLLDPFAFTARQGSAVRDGHATTPLGRNLHQAWEVSFGGHTGGHTSNVVIADGRVFVVHSGGHVADGLPALEAFSSRDGSVLWGPEPLSASGFVDDLVYDAGRLFTATEQGIVQAWDPFDGHLLWTQNLNGPQSSFSTHLSAGNGFVVVGGGGAWDELFALHEDNGAVAWKDHGPTVVGSSEMSIVGGVLVVPGDCRAAGLSLESGVQLWFHGGWDADAQCYAAAPGWAPVHNGLVHVEGVDAGPVVEATTGTVVAQDRTRGLPSFDGTDEFWLSDHTISAVDTTTGSTRWTSAAADYVGPTLTVDGMVVALAADGRVDVLEEQTGSVLWTAAGQPWPDDALSHPLPGIGVAAGDGILVVPSQDGLRTFAGDGVDVLPAAVSPPSLAAPDLPAPGTPPAGGTEWTGYGGDARHDGYNGAESAHAPYTPAWTATLGGVTGAPVILRTGVFVTSASADGTGWIHGFATATAEPLWPAVQVAGWDSRWRPPPLSSDSGVLVSSGVAVTAATGRVRWTLADGGRPQAVNGKVYIGDAIYDLATGEQEYTIGQFLDDPLGGPAPYPDDFDVVDGTTWYVAGACGDVVRLDGTKQAWRSVYGCVGGTQAQHGLMQSTVVVDNNGAYIDVDTTTGQTRDATASTRLPAAAGDTFFAVDGTRIRAEHAHTHRINWTRALPAPAAAQPVVAGTTVLVLDTAGNLTAFDAITGARQWSGALPEDAGTVPTSTTTSWVAAAQGVVAVPTSTGVTVWRGTPAAPTSADGGGSTVSTAPTGGGGGSSGGGGGSTGPSGSTGGVVDAGASQDPPPATASPPPPVTRTAPTLTVNGPRSITADDSVTLTGRLAAGGAPLAAAQLLVGQLGGPRESVTTDGEGRFRVRIRVVKAGRLGAYYAGSRTMAPVLTTIDSPRVHWRLRAHRRHRSRHWVVHVHVRPSPGRITVLLHLSGGHTRVLHTNDHGNLRHRVRHRPTRVVVPAAQHYARAAERL